jgi:hypothetical protein
MTCRTYGLDMTSPCKRWCSGYKECHLHLSVALQARSLTPWKVSTKFHHSKVIGTGCKFTSIPQEYRGVPSYSPRTIGQDPPKVTCAHPLVALQARSLTPWKVYTKFPWLEVIGTAWNLASTPSPSKRVVLLSLRTVGQDPPKVIFHLLVASQARSLTPWKVYTKFPYLKPIGTGCNFTSVPQGYREVPPCSLRTVGQDPPKVIFHLLVALQARSLTPWKVSKKFHHLEVIGSGPSFTSIP